MFRILAVLALAGAVFAAALGSAAALNVSGGAIGSGNAAVAGFTVTDVRWFISGDKVDAVAFNIDPDATYVNASTNLAPWVGCGNGGGVSREWFCDLDARDAAATTTLYVTAAQ
ncbi:MAG: hypothetical protein Q8R28_05040 [Dehalococcoidia bacterium]|nr:hypothetical protein [Dehalococcoidia bacterium]